LRLYAANTEDNLQGEICNMIWSTSRSVSGQTVHRH